jgi:hypothetical protein
MERVCLRIRIYGFTITIEPPAGSFFRYCMSPYDQNRQMTRTSHEQC